MCIFYVHEHVNKGILRLNVSDIFAVLDIKVAAVLENCSMRLSNYMKLIKTRGNLSEVKG